MKDVKPDKKELLSKYDGNTSDKLLTHMKRHFPASDKISPLFDEPIKFISINDRLYVINGNKKRLVDRLSDYLEADWVHLDYRVFRRTIKKYIDGNLL